MGEQKVVIYHHPNPEMKSFLTPLEIFPPRVEHLKNPLKEDSQAILKNMGLIGGQVVRDIMALHGVLALEVKPKEIRVKKEVSASWEDLQDRIVVILERGLRRKSMKVVKSS